MQGHPDPLRGTIDAPIGRHPSGDGRFAVVTDGRPSVTHYDTLEAFRAASLIEVKLETGRTHQIRVHMAAVRHPCVGDRLYGADPVLAARLGLDRQWLHAVSLAFAHPDDGRWVEFTSDYPADLAAAPGIARSRIVVVRALTPSGPASVRYGPGVAGGDRGFAHLHVHTEYSMLDGAARLNDVFEQCNKTGMSAIAMTDHGNVYGAYDFYKKARSAGIKPIIGIEAYVAPEHRAHKQPVRWGTPAQRDDDVSGAGAYTHLTILAETTEGMHNLFRLSSLASLEGYFRQPRMDLELLSKYSKGLIATTGCPSGAVQTRIRLGQYDQAVAAAAQLRDIFGPRKFLLWK